MNLWTAPPGTTCRALVPSRSSGAAQCGTNPGHGQHFCWRHRAAHHRECQHCATKLRSPAEVGAGPPAPATHFRVHNRDDPDRLTVEAALLGSLCLGAAGHDPTAGQRARMTGLLAQHASKSRRTGRPPKKKKRKRGRSGASGGGGAGSEHGAGARNAGGRGRSRGQGRGAARRRRERPVSATCSRALDFGGRRRTLLLVPVFLDRLLKTAQKRRARVLYDAAMGPGGDGLASLTPKVRSLARGTRFRSNRAWTPAYATKVGLHVGIPGFRVVEAYAHYKVMFRTLIGDVDEDDTLFAMFGGYSLDGNGAPGGQAMAR